MSSDVKAVSAGEPETVNGKPETDAVVPFNIEELQAREQAGWKAEDLPRLVVTLKAFMGQFIQVDTMLKQIGPEHRAMKDILACLLKEKFGPLRFNIKTADSLPRKFGISWTAEGGMMVVRFVENDAAPKLVLPGDK